MRALLVVIALACAAPASAQATRTWVASTGDDSGPCSRSQPCGTFAAALAKTAPAGEIDCVDRGGFGPVTIAKAVTIDCTGSLGGILASSADAVLVNAGAADSVVLRGLSLQGSASSANGIHVAAAGVVVIEGVEINGFGNNGISLQAPNASTSIANVHITNTASSGIFVSPIGGPATASIEHVSIVHTVDGIAVDGSGGITFVTMRDSSISFCATNGALVQAGFGPAATLTLDGVAFTHNGNGANAANGGTIIIGRSSFVAHSGSALDVTGGQIATFGDNTVAGNAVNVSGSTQPVPRQ